MGFLKLYAHVLHKHFFVPDVYRHTFSPLTSPPLTHWSWQLRWNLTWFDCNTLAVRPPLNNILLYCTPQLYDKLALPDFTVFSCQREPEPVFSHQIVSNTERAHCAEQKASPVLSLSLLMYGAFFFFPPTNRNTEIWFNVFVHELLRSVSKKELLLEPTRDSEDKSHFHHSGMENSKLRINGVIFRVSATSKKKRLWKTPAIQ